MWGVLGSKLHDKLEEITNGEASPEELKGIVDQELDYLDMIELEFPKDFKGEDSIRNNWRTNMQHFCDHFTPLKGKYTTEELVILKIDDDHYIQGYVDLVKHNNDGSVSILDWKTSSLYSKEDFKHAVHQLIIYAMAKEQAGETIKSLAWIFMKYASVTFMGKKRSNSKTKTEITKVIERRNIARELAKYIEDDLYAAGYDEVESQMYINQVYQDNSLEGLPDEIKANYIIKPHVQSAEYTEEAKQTTMKYILDTINDFESREESEDAWEPREFYSVGRNGKQREDTFYCNALCDFGHTCKYIQMFNAEKAAENKEEEDEYGGLFG